MITIILAAGYGTRLYPLTKDKPKSLLQIGGKPIINYITNQLQNKIYIVTNQKFYDQFIEWAKTQNKDIEIINDNTTSNETRLGGIGDLYFTIKLKNINDDILVLGGDNVFDFKIKDFIEFFKQKQAPVIALYDVQDLELAKLYGIVELDKNRKIISFEEKPKNPKSTLASTCFYVFPKEFIKEIYKYMQTSNNKDGPGYLIKHFYTKQPIYGFVFKGNWFDIGNLEQYKKANEIFK